MAFTWKGHKEIWKGEGIYHLTFRVADGVVLGEIKGRSREDIAAAVQPLKESGAACDVSNPDYVAVTKGLAWVELTEFGRAVQNDIANFDKRHEGVTVCQKIVMDTHIHLVVWVKKDTGKSILQIGQGFRTGITRIAREMGVWPLAAASNIKGRGTGSATASNVTGGGTGSAAAGNVTDEGTRSAAAGNVTDATRPTDKNAIAPDDNNATMATNNDNTMANGNGATMATNNDTTTINNNNATMATNSDTTTINNNGATMATNNDNTMANGNGVSISSSRGDEQPYHIFQKPYVRTLYAKGQLRTMIDYVTLNAYRKWIKHLYPELFTMHKLTVIRGLRFRSMGNHWLLDWSIKQMVECNRNVTEKQLEAHLEKVMMNAEMGAVTYTAAVNDNEWYIINKVLEAGFPVVCHMKDGFPPAGSEAEKMYKPGGKMNDACGQGRLLLLVANKESYSDRRVIELTEQALERKAKEKHLSYTPIPHESKRWRYIAGNEMMRLLQE